MSTLQILRPDPFWLWVQAEHAFEVPQAVLDVPGVRYEQPAEGYSTHRCEVPWTAWDVPAFLSWFEDIYGSHVGSARPVYRGPGADAHLVGAFSLFERLFPHQRDGVRFLLEHPQAVLGDEMGCGKSRVAAVAASILRQTLREAGQPARPVLIVGPKYLRSTWKHEIEAADVPGFCDFVALEGIQPDLSKLEGAQWIFSHYDVLHAWWSQILICRPAVAIVDEAHLAKNSRTRRGKAVALATSITPYRFLLTGTPVENRVGEFWNLLQLATGKWTWGSPRTFRERYAGATMGTHGLVDGPAPTHTDELRTRLASCYLRRTKRDAGVELPPLTRQVVEIELTSAERAAHRELLQGMDASTVLQQIRQHKASKATIEWLGKLRKLTSKAKERATIEEIASALEQGEHVLCFTWQKKTAEAIANRVWATWIDGDTPTRNWQITAVHGDHSAAERERVVANFQKLGGLLVATGDSLGVGVTLHKASLVVMHDLDWVPSRMLQWEARAHRIGLDHPVLSKWMVAKGTLDELLVKALLKKAPRIAETVGDEEPGTLADLLGEAIDEEHASWDGLLGWAKGG